MPGLVAYSAAGLGLLALAALPLRLPPPPHSPRPPAPPRGAALRALPPHRPALLRAPQPLLPAHARRRRALPPLRPRALPPSPRPSSSTSSSRPPSRRSCSSSRTAAGIENRYFDLFLVPVTVCLGATLLAAHSPDAAPPRLAHAAGLALQGTWMVQMGFSFFTDAVATGCALHADGRVDYTVRCRSHEDYHRARSVATLQFNGHLALLVLAGAAAYAAVVSRGGGSGLPIGYRMLGKEVQMEGLPSQFTLDSDDEEKEGEEITAATPVANGVHSHHQVELQVPESK